MHTYKIYDKNLSDGFKAEWFSPKTIEDFYGENQKSIVFESEEKFCKIFKIFSDTNSFRVHEFEKYHEYYGIDYMKKAYPKEYPPELFSLYENLEENREYAFSDAENIFKLMFRGHIWCILKSSDAEMFFEKPGILTVSTDKILSDTAASAEQTGQLCEIGDLITEQAKPSESGGEL